MTNRSGNATGIIGYSLDHADRIVGVDGAWRQFAQQNGAADLTPDRVANRPIWRFISDPDTRVIYRLLFDAVRTRTRSLTVSFRCDSPTRRRFMRLTCSPGPRLGIDIRSEMLREETRPYISTLDSGIAHGETVVKLCAWCKQCEVSARDWRELEEALPLLGAFDDSLPPMVTHGMCPDCHLTKTRQIRNGLQQADTSTGEAAADLPPPG